MWETVDASLIDKIKDGTVTLADLTSAGAIQRGVSSDDYGLGCPDTGHGCKDVYAVSIPGVTPSRFITWFQAAAAARNSGTRLPTNAEWQVAALGTPDTVLPGPGPADCNTFSFGGPDLTGNRTNCFSDVGAFDMVGNVAEWVTNWGPVAGIMNLPNFSDDYFNCAGVQAVQALVRGGNFNAGANGRDAGPFSSECVAVMTGSGLVGFRIFR
ncbi:MAG: formylglycine-generating enzyme family protein [Deltaproteobacteria bacterium]|nr:formylglycine-generating enzyme family protein [Deltaproteobacteria bacterium]